MFSTDTVEEAEDLQQLFCTLVSKGALAGRYVTEIVARAPDDKAIEAMHELRRKMAEAYANMKARKP